MKKNNVLNLLVLFFLIISFNGCVYIRLLEVKNQMNDFERNFLLDSKEDFVITSLKPILNVNDVKFLLNAKPDKISSNYEILEYVYIFEKEINFDENRDYSIPFILFFDEKKFYKVNFHDRFPRVLPKQFVIDTMKALGNSKIKIDGFEIKIEYTQKMRNTKRFPGKNQIEILFGQPSEKLYKNKDLNLNYTYKLRSKKNRKLTIFINFILDDKNKLKEVNLKLSNLRII